MIDLHTHTDASDGTCPPRVLVEDALKLGLEALAICDHDTFAGYDEAVPLARAAGLDLVCGIELSTGIPSGGDLHLLGYFLDQPPSEEFRKWLGHIQACRHDRNLRMANRLQSLGINVRLKEVEALGRSLAGRAHFAQLLIQKGYAANQKEAFDRYLGETGKAYVERERPDASECIVRIRAAGGFSSLAHPVRAGRNSGNIEETIRQLKEYGLEAIEVYHSDHRPEHVSEFLRLAASLNLAITGGSDFHGKTKPGVQLGTGYNGNLNIPRAVLDALRELRLH